MQETNPIVFTIVLYEHAPCRDIENQLYWKEDVHEHLIALRSRYVLQGFINLGDKVRELCNRGDVRVIRKENNMFDSWDDLVKSDMWKSRNKEMEIIKERIGCTCRK